MDDRDAVRFLSLFAGNCRSHGVYKPPSRMLTVPVAPSVDDVVAHLSGVTGLGVVPILDDGTCWWGAIDVDNHGQSVDLPIVDIAGRVKDRGYPLICCRSKSGGVHLYLFLKKPCKARNVRQLLRSWADGLAISGVDCVFPKQDALATGQFGNWINLPYFDAVSTGRYAVLADGKRLSLSDFLDLADASRFELLDLDGYAPPCISSLVKRADKVTQGGRNNALFHIAVYLNKACPDSLMESLKGYNERFLDPPLSDNEVSVLAASVSGRDYGYFCDKEPWRSLCDRLQCRRCVYGARGKDETAVVERSAAGAFPDVDRFVKFAGTSPVQWELTITGVAMVFTTDELMDYSVVRERVFESMHCVLPQMKGETWISVVLPDLLNRLEVCHPEATGGGVDDLMEHLVEFLSFTDFSMKPNSKVPDAFPVLVSTKSLGDAVVWRGHSFERRLKQAKVDVAKSRLWYVVSKQCGVKFARVRLKGSLMRVWYLPVDDVVRLLQSRYGVEAFSDLSSGVSELEF